MLSINEISQYLEYNPNTGIFTWKVSRGPAKAGSRAGSVVGGGYRNIVLKGNVFREHRLAYLFIHGCWPQLEMDHINHDREDNRWNNLREVCSQQNRRNMSKRTSTKVTGVNWSSRLKKWQAYIGRNYKTHYLGTFTKFTDAVAARKKAEQQFNFHPNHGK